MQSLLDSLALWQLAGLFAFSAAAVWFGGSRLAGYVDAITDRTGLGQAFIGMLLLGGITSLPEAAAVMTSAATGNAPLAINNLLGTASINILLLAFADILYGREALTAAAARPVTLMQGVLSMMLATAVAMIATIGDIALFGVGAGALALALGAVAAMWITSDFEHRHVWEVVGDGDGHEKTRHDERSTGRLVTYIALCALLILAAGFMLSLTADRIAAETGVGASLVGFALVGFATSLPEVSSITAAVRLRRYQLAIGDVFGTNIFNVMRSSSPTSFLVATRCSARPGASR